MTPPGLTCTRCHQPLYPRTCRRTPDGLTHADRCQRPCDVDGCTLPHLARGYCRQHYAALVEGKQPRTIDLAAFVEDVEWMAATGETWEGALRRLGLAGDTCARRLERAGRGDLITALRRQEVA